MLARLNSKSFKLGFSSMWTENFQMYNTAELKPSEVKVTQSCLTLCNPIDYTIDGILQARILEWVAFPFSKGSSQPRDWTQVFCIAGRFFTNWAIREYKLDLGKAEKPEIKLPTSVVSWRKQGNSRKTSTSAFLTMPKPLTVWITINCGKFKRWEYQTTWLASWEIYMQVRKQQLELDMEQQTGSK